MKLSKKILEEVSRWKKEVSSGNFSKENISKIRKNVAKSPEEYSAGLNKGSRNIASKIDADFDDSKMSLIKKPADSIKGMMFGNYYQQPSVFGNSTIRVPDKVGLANTIAGSLIGLNPRKMSPIEKSILTRHETNEAKYFDQGDISLAKVGVNDKLKGMHNTMKVIADEARDVNLYNNLFGKEGAPLIYKKRQQAESPVMQSKLGFSYDDINYGNHATIKNKINSYEKNIVQKELDEKNDKMADVMVASMDNNYPDDNILGRIKNKVDSIKNIRKATKMMYSPLQAYSINK